MIEIQEMQNDEIEDLLSTVNYGHLACARNNLPYVVPIHFAYVSPYIFVYTTEGKKSEIIRVNPEVCLQLEDVKDNRDWRSVIVSGEATQLNNEVERQEAMEAILKVNPTLTPAVSIRWMDSWVRENVEVIYRITPRVTSGRKSVDRSETEGFAPDRARRPNIY